MKRKIGISWNCFGQTDIDEQIALMKENGFTATFLCSENRSLIGQMAPKLDAAGIAFETLHAPFDKINDIWKPGEAGERMLQRLTDAVSVCADYGIPALIVHLSSGLNPPIVGETGHARWVRLMEEAEKKKILVCYENQRMLSNLAYAFEQFPAARFCWDVGHEACFSPGRRYMPLFGKALAALHIHDNHGGFNQDEHLIPFDGTLDFSYAAREIAKAGYPGSVMLEIMSGNSHAYDGWSIQEYYRHAGEAARRLADMLDGEDRRLTGR